MHDFTLSIILRVPRSLPTKYISAHHPNGSIKRNCQYYWYCDFCVAKLQGCVRAHRRTDGGTKGNCSLEETPFRNTNTLEGLKDTLTSDSEPAYALDSILQKTKLDIALKSTQGVCDEFGEAIKGFTRHSTDTRFSNRDRVAVSFHEPKVARFCQRLGECQSTISLALVSINLQVLPSIILFSTNV